MESLKEKITNLFEKDISYEITPCTLEGIQYVFVLLSDKKHIVLISEENKDDSFRIQVFVKNKDETLIVDPSWSYGNDYYSRDELSKQIDIMNSIF
jgi:hypothetical protein